MSNIKSTLSDRGDVYQTSAKFKWNLANFPNYCGSSGERILSPIFSSGSMGECKWNLELYPYNYRSEDSDYISIYVVSKNDFTVAVSYEISILDESSSTPPHKRITKNQKFNKRNESWGFHKFIARQDLLDKCKEKTLTILFELSTDNVPDREQIPGNCTTSTAVQRQILQNYEHLLEDERFWDVRLVDADEKELHAHKAILSAGSTVFANMFDHDMIERQKNTVTIDDIDHDTLKELIRYIYAGRVENLEKLAKSLYIAADKYRIEELMNMCTDYLCQNLSLTNAVDYLSFGYLYGIELLKNETKKYIVRKANDFVDQPDFKSLNNQHTKMIFELFQELVSQNKK